MQKHTNDPCTAIIVTFQHMTFWCKIPAYYLLFKINVIQIRCGILWFSPCFIRYERKNQPISSFVRSKRSVRRISRPLKVRRGAATGKKSCHEEEEASPSFLEGRVWESKWCEKKRSLSRWPRLAPQRLLPFSLRLNAKCSLACGAAKAISRVFGQPHPVRSRDLGAGKAINKRETSNIWSHFSSQLPP